MDDLVQWLGEQLDADERDAKARRGIFPSPAVNDDGSVCLHVRPGGNMAITWYQHPAEGWDDMAKLKNWANAENGWTQERVLQEIAAKRKLLVRGGPLCTSNCDDPDNEPKNPDTNWTTPLEHHFDCAAYEAAKVLTLPYADRSGYREEWRP